MKKPLKANVTHERPGQPSESPYAYRYPTPAHALAELIALMVQIEARIDKERAGPHADRQGSMKYV